MKKITYLFALILCLTACNSNKGTSTQNKNTATDSEISIGGQRDKNGCLTPAGQTWSELLQRCIRVFDEGTRLNPTTPESGAVFSAFVVFNSDQSQLELFLPHTENTTLLQKTAEGLYKNQQYTYDANQKVLMIEGKTKFAAE